MAKNIEKKSFFENLSTDGKNNTPIKNKISGKLITAAVVILAAAGGWYVYQNPQLFAKSQELSLQKQEIDALKEQIIRLSNQVQALQAEKSQDISRQEWEKINNTFVKRTAFLNEKINKSLQINKEILDAKASNAAVLGLVTRVDGLETKVQTLGKVSSQGALILTAAMLVKDASASGKPFVYEAEVLRQLAAGTNMEKAAETIALSAANGVATPQMLIDEFNLLYEEQNAKNTNKTSDSSEQQTNSETSSWKEKLSKLIVVEHSNKENISKTVKESDADKIYQLVNKGDFSQAVLLMQTNVQYQTPAFKSWQEKYAKTVDFAQALNNIQALTLAFMKVENLKNESVVQ